MDRFNVLNGIATICTCLNLAILIYYDGVKVLNQILPNNTTAKI
jgi:hypothetical protein